MFYIASVKDGLYGIMDTQDGVLESYTLDQLEVIKKSAGIRIYRQADMLKFVHFVWHFCLNSNEFGNDEFSDVIDFLEGKGKNSFGGSRHDYVASLKSDYLEMKKMGFTFDLRNMFYSDDMLIKDLCKLYIDNSQDYDRIYSKQRCTNIAKKWYLREKEVIYYFS